MGGKIFVIKFYVTVEARDIKYNVFTIKFLINSKPVLSITSDSILLAFVYATLTVTVNIHPSIHFLYIT